MTEQEYRDKFELSDQEVREVWPIIQSVFKVPDVKDRHEYDAWPRFPDSIYQDACELAFLAENFFGSEYLLNMFRHFLIEVDEDRFFVVPLPDDYESSPCRVLSYSAGVNWADFAPDNRMGMFVRALFAIDHYVIGESGRWGLGWVEAWNLYMAGYKDREVLEALQSTYDFEGRGAEVIEPLPRRREARRLHEIADQIRAEEEGGTPS
jgi:hypothetical protein